jgi:hypothetical protein
MKHSILKLVLALLLPVSLVLGPTDLILCKGMIQKRCECCPEMSRGVGASSFSYEKESCCRNLSVGLNTFFSVKNNNSFQDQFNLFINVIPFSKVLLDSPTKVVLVTSQFLFNFHPPLFLIKSSFLI